MSETGGIRIRTLLPEDDGRRWDAWVRDHEAGTFFHLSPWRGIFEDVFRHRTLYLLAERGNDIVGVLPMVEVKSRLFGHSVSSLPFCAYAGAIGEDAAVHLLEERADELATERGAEYLEFRNRAPHHEDWPRQDLYVTFRKVLEADVEANLKAIPRKQRAMVRKGIKNDLRGVIDGDVGRFFDLYADNVHRHGTPALSKRYFAELLRRFAGSCDVLTIEDRDGRPVSSVLSFYFRDEVLPYYAGDLDAARKLAANDFKYWDLMRRAVERGSRVFDYGRSKVGTGPFSFKKNWGFEPTPLYYEYRLLKRDSMPQQNPLNPKYKAMIAIWRRLPLSVANALGPHIVRNLG